MQVPRWLSKVKVCKTYPQKECPKDLLRWEIFEGIQNLHKDQCLSTNMYMPNKVYVHKNVKKSRLQCCQTMSFRTLGCVYITDEKPSPQLLPPTSTFGQLFCRPPNEIPPPPPRCSPALLLHKFSAKQMNNYAESSPIRQQETNSSTIVLLSYQMKCCNTSHYMNLTGKWRNILNTLLSIRQLML